MSVKISKRNFIRGLLGSVGVHALLSGCSTLPSSDGCEATADSLTASLCRQQRIRDSAPEFVTLGMLVGAAIGAGVGYAIGGDPITGALVGAIAGGSVAAVDRYISYRREQANYDEMRMFKDIKRDIRADVAYARTTLKDQNTAQQTALRSLENPGGDLLANSNRFGTAQEVVSVSKKNTLRYSRTSEIYGEVLQKTKLGDDREAQANLSELVEAKESLKTSGQEYVSALRAKGYFR
jgi:hypothetical protein